MDRNVLGKILYLSPHRDDECLSCGGTLLLHDDVHIHYFNSHHPDITTKCYDKEAEDVKEKLGCSVSYSRQQWTNNLAEFPIHLHVNIIEDLINEYNPDTLILPHISYNQDHRVVYNAALTAARVHDANLYVKNILIAEQPGTHTPAVEIFVPHVFVEIDIKHKIELYELYETQQRGHRRPEHVRHLAGFRGMQCDKPYAEAFMVVRMTYGL